MGFDKGNVMMTRLSSLVRVELDIFPEKNV